MRTSRRNFLVGAAALMASASLSIRQALPRATNEIQRLIDEAVLSGRRYVNLQAGASYYVMPGAPIFIPAGIHLNGNGATIIAPMRGESETTE